MVLLSTSDTINWPLLYSLSLCCTDVMAPRTDNLLTLLLMFEAVPNSSANIFATREIWSFGGMMSEIMLVPFLKIVYISLYDYNVLEHKNTEYCVLVIALFISCNEMQWEIHYKAVCSGNFWKLKRIIFYLLPSVHTENLEKYKSTCKLSIVLLNEDVLIHRIKERWVSNVKLKGCKWQRKCCLQADHSLHRMLACIKTSWVL